jgi:hypothetical protein
VLKKTTDIAAVHDAGAEIASCNFAFAIYKDFYNKE